MYTRTVERQRGLINNIVIERLGAKAATYVDSVDHNEPFILDIMYYGRRLVTTLSVIKGKQMMKDTVANVMAFSVTNTSLSEARCYIGYIATHPMRSLTLHL